MRQQSGGHRKGRALTQARTHRARTIQNHKPRSSLQEREPAGGARRPSLVAVDVPVVVSGSVERGILFPVERERPGLVSHLRAIRTRTARG